VQRIPEPELMDEDAQAQAYALADFSEPHERFVALFREVFGEAVGGCVLDLGCGPADVTLRFARAYPGCRIDGMDGAAAMLRYGREAVARAGLGERVRLMQGYLPGAELPQAHYDVLISNSLLHHLADPSALWEALRHYGRPGALVFVMDLMRPADSQTAARLVEEYAATEPEVLRRDFHNSLLAAYRPAEIEAQLAHRGLAGALAVRVVSDRHLVIAGRI
jgi:SAM-dependent methyltransferase